MQSTKKLLSITNLKKYFPVAKSSIFQKQQLIMEMPHGRIKTPSMLTAISKSTCDSNSPDGIQAVGILNNLPLKCLRLFSPVPAERNGIDRRDNTLCLFRGYVLPHQK